MVLIYWSKRAHMGKGVSLAAKSMGLLPCFKCTKRCQGLKRNKNYCLAVDKKQDKLLSNSLLEILW
jgi:hypothetical protein